MQWACVSVGFRDAPLVHLGRGTGQAGMGIRCAEPQAPPCLRLAIVLHPQQLRSGEKGDGLCDHTAQRLSHFCPIRAQHGSRSYRPRRKATMSCATAAISWATLLMVSRMMVVVMEVSPVVAPRGIARERGENRRPDKRHGQGRRMRRASGPMLHGSGSKEPFPGCAVGDTARNPRHPAGAIDGANP